MVLVVGQNSAWQKTCWIDALQRGAVNRVERVVESAAGKGANTARVLVSYGVAHELHGYAGGANGQAFSSACCADGLTVQFTEIERETRVCTTFIEDDLSVTEVIEPAPEISPSERERARGRFFDRIPHAALLAICGTALNGESDDCYIRMVAEAHERTVPVILDSYRLHGRLALEAHPEILKINRDELAELSSLPIESDRERLTAYCALAERYNLRWIIITHGREGAEAFNGRAVVRVRPPEVRAVNPIGSGDSVTAGIVAHVVQSASVAGEQSGAAGHRVEQPDWLDVELLRMAVVEGVSAGTANCLSAKPGYIQADHLEHVRTGCTVQTRPLS